MTGLEGNSYNFVSRGGAERNIEMRRKHNELFPEGPVLE